MQQPGLTIFGSFFVVLSVGVALFVGFGSVEVAVPVGDVAMVEGAPRGLEVISKAELEEEVELQAAQVGEGAIRPGSSAYRQLVNEALTLLIEKVWLYGQAEELGVMVTAAEIARHDPAEAKAMREAGYTQEDVDARMRWYMTGDQIQEVLTEGRTKPSSAEVRASYDEDPPEGKSFAEARVEIENALRIRKEAEVLAEARVEQVRQWQPRTHCAPGFVVSVCGEFQPFSHPETAPPACYEADPRKPPAACPAPVQEAPHARPGTVTLPQPEGEDLIQTPLPEAQGG